MFARFCGFGPGHKSTRNVTKVFRDDIKEAFGLTDNYEAPEDDVADIEVEGLGDDHEGEDVGVDEEEDCEDDQEAEDFDGEEGGDDDLVGDLDEDEDEDEDDGDLDGLVDGLGYGAL